MQHLRSYYGSSVDAVITAMSLVGTIIVVVLVGAVIAVMVALVLRLQQHHRLVQWLTTQWCWRSDCGNGVGAAIAEVLVQRLQQCW